MKKQQSGIVVAQCNIDWQGRKVAGSHNGTIAQFKGIIKPIGFDANISVTGDTLIYNDFDLNVALTAKAVA